MAKKIRVLNNRVLVKPILKDKDEKSGIIFTEDENKEIRGEAEVIEIGDGEEIKKFNLKKGDRVLIRRWGGEVVKIEKEKYRVLEPQEIFCLINK